jgi:putative transposase
VAGKREKPEDIVLKLRQVEVLLGKGKSVQEAVRQIDVTVPDLLSMAQGIRWDEPG